MRDTRVDKTDPVLAARWSLTEEGSVYVSRFKFSPTELSSSSYKFWEGVDRGSGEGYQFYRRVPVRITVVGVEYGGRPRVKSIVNGASFLESELDLGASATAFGTGLVGAGDSQVNFLVPGEVRLGVGRVEVGGVVVEREMRSASEGLFFTNTEGLA